MVLVSLPEFFENQILNETFFQKTYDEEELFVHVNSRRHEEDLGEGQNFSPLNDLNFDLHFLIIY